MKRIGILGSGNVGLALAKGLKDAGYEIILANRSAHAVEGWDGEVKTIEEAAKNGEIIILTVKGSAAKEVAASLKDSLAGKTVLDTTNPIADAAPEDGVLKFFTSLDRSLMEDLQEAAPDAHFVKAFNSVGAGNMVNPQYSEGKPTMFICGNDEAAKKEAGELTEVLGFEVADMGSAKAARAIEPLCMLYCIPGMLNNQWSHAFKLLK